ncbi:enoyl-CoA hydratase/isomerase family protein [Thalassotalea sp. ND16A]|uniref:enoyl-CoA hydratase/isomerase family protein n=1 Tax=Thalassotalea sp. ND16A TaxID=1535422 RepID=UPI00051A53D2|nr:enoyl-CoA hydratase/isomerase family protein [Thalassotalea sp. ND16A]KGJ87862.1 hypothetical protein ND16A_2776 [Thalassotalea sp. ND16A]
MTVVNYELKGNVAVITLNRPDAMNTFNPDMYREFNAATTRFRDEDSAWVAVICAAGDKAFSAGVDIKAISKATSQSENIEELAAAFDIELECEYFCDKPIIAAIHGFCIGEGLSMALGCDLRIASRSASFALPESKIGIPTINAAMHGARIMGASNALEMLLMGEQRDSAWAYRTGLINKVVDDDQLMNIAMEWAQKIASLSPLANRITKEMTVKSSSRSFDENAAIGVQKRKKILVSQDFKEGQRAFIEKRTPKFIGA